MLERYYFLFALAFVWIVFATVQDLRKREVANWLNFSLIGFALAYRAFYSAYFNEWKFFLFGLIGFGLFFVLANLFYYTKIFAGGDAKLLMGLGAVLPFSSFIDFFYIGLGFIVILFLAGAVYGLFYSIFIVSRNREKFAKELLLVARKRKYLFLIPVVFVIFSFIASLLFYFPFEFWGIASLFVLFLTFLYIYMKGVEKCMIKLVKPADLTEGDWLEADIKVGNGWIRKSVHGLNVDDILKLRKANKNVLIKEGIPFVPAFLIAFLLMVFFYAISGQGFENLVYLLLS